MNFPISILFVMLCATFAIAQEQEFTELSAKERISIAEKEEREAKQDARFQQIMLEGHELFKDKHYLKAIHKYEEASERRPYNVYPKVIIADIELSMKDTLEILRDAEKKAQQNLNQNKEPKEELKPKEEPKEEKLPEKPEETIQRLNNWEEKERARLERERERKKQNSEVTTPVSEPTGDVSKISIQEYQKELAETFPEGITETVTEEGNKKIIRRIVVTGGIGNEYKKVIHNWGGVFYFKNGDAVTERVWKAETEK